MTGTDTFVTVMGPRLLLRDPLPTDFDARCRWTTVETDWQDWDAPCEGKTVSPPRPPEEHETARQQFLEKLAEPLPTPRNKLWIQMVDGPLLGWVNSYHHDPAARSIFIGISICESDYWCRGLGTEAFRLWIDYQFVQLDLARIHTATWSGNLRMVRVAGKCGFSLTNREIGKREVRGEWYDGLTFALTREKWMERKGAR